MTVSYDEVKYCPACKEPGESRTGARFASAARGTSTLIFYCRNARCKWYDTAWIVEVMPDGTIHPPVVNRTKQFPALPTSSNARLLVSNLQELHDMLLQPGTEWRR